MTNSDAVKSDAAKSEAAQFLSNLPFFAGLPADDLADIVRESDVVTVEKHDNIFFAGDKASTLFVIMSGWVKLFRDTQDGAESVLGLFTRADTFGDAVMFDGANYPHSAQSVETCRLIKIPSTALKSKAKSNPDFVYRMMASLSRHMQKLQLENEHLSLMTAPQRVGCLLLQFAVGMEGKTRTIRLPFDKALAAARLGMKPETFSRALAQLKGTGVNVFGADITIEDFDRLVDFCCTSCSSDPGECLFSQSGQYCGQNCCGAS